MSSEPFLPYACQQIKKRDIEAVKKALELPIITRGIRVQEFEEAVADYCGAKYAVAFNNGSSALHATAHVTNLSSCDKYLTTPNSFFATTSPAIQRQVDPIFVDINREDGNLNLNQIKENQRVRLSRGKYVIAPVHFAGIPVNMKALNQTVISPDTLIIEDAAHAFGSKHDDEHRIGSCYYSDLCVFSFHAIKCMTTGEGGMVTTNNEEFYKKLIQFRNNGIVIPEDTRSDQPWFYEVREATGNYHMTDFQAALGLSQLSRVDTLITERKEAVEWYWNRLADDERFRLMPGIKDPHTSPHLFVVQIDFEAFGLTRGECMKALKDAGIGTQVHYIPIYRHPVLKNSIGDVSNFFPEMEAYYAQALSLPLFPGIKEKDVERVCAALKKLTDQKAKCSG